MINHQKSICTGLKSEYRFKKKCDKCLESISVSKFSYHYSICTGVKKTGFKKARENCPDCGLEMNASNIRKHKKKCKGRSRLAEGDVKCPDCGEVFKNKGKDKVDSNKKYFFIIDLSLILLMKYVEKCKIKHIF